MLWESEECHIDAAVFESGNQLDLTVFISVVYLVKKPQERAAMSIPFPVRLQRMDLRTVLSTQIPERSSTAGAPPVPCRDTTARAMQVHREARDRSINSGIIQHRQFANEIIKSGPQIMDNFTNDDRPADRWLRQIGLDSETVKSCFRIELSGHHRAPAPRVPQFPCRADIGGGSGSGHGRSKPAQPSHI